jgi:hypothetical protein
MNRVKRLKLYGGVTWVCFVYWAFAFMMLGYGISLDMQGYSILSLPIFLLAWFLWFVGHREDEGLKITYLTKRELERHNREDE